MSLEAEVVFAAPLVGVGATALLDLWALILKSIAGVPPTNWCVVGRWFCHMPSGRFVHSPISSAAHKEHECAVGWLAHYIIGGIYGFVLVLVAKAGWLAAPTLLPALLFGLVTMVFPFFVMQPCFGLGWASSRTPKPAVARLKTLMSHSVFGVGMYLSALALSAVPSS